MKNKNKCSRIARWICGKKKLCTQHSKKYANNREEIDKDNIEEKKIRVMIISEKNIIFYNKVNSIIDLVDYDRIQFLSGCLLKKCTIYCDEHGLMKKNSYLNQLANPLIDENMLIWLACRGCPRGDLIIYNEGNILPMNKIIKLYKNYMSTSDYESEDELNEWYDILKEGLEKFGYYD